MGMSPFSLLVGSFSDTSRSVRCSTAATASGAQQVASTVYAGMRRLEDYVGLTLLLVIIQLLIVGVVAIEQTLSSSSPSSSPPTAVASTTSPSIRSSSLTSLTTVLPPLHILNNDHPHVLCAWGEHTQAVCWLANNGSIMCRGNTELQRRLPSNVYFTTISCGTVLCGKANTIPFVCLVIC
jgi:hypothetical protein